MKIFFSLFTIFLALNAEAATRNSRTSVASGTASRSNGGDTNVHWTLADWLTEKQSFLSQDHWLALGKTLTNFEFNVGGGQSSYTLRSSGGSTVDTTDWENHGDISLYWSIFGLEYKIENSSEGYNRQSGQFNLRLVGQNSRQTNLVGYYGVRKTDYSSPSPANSITNPYAGGSLDLYIFSFFGINGAYTKNFKAEDSLVAGHQYQEGDRVDYGAFIDIYYVRLYGKGWQETNKKSPIAGGTATNEKRSGVTGGVQLYF